MYKAKVTPQKQISAELAILTIETPATNYDKFKNIWNILNREKIYFANSQAFELNGLLAGFASRHMVPYIENAMLETGSQKTSTTFLLATEKLSDELLVSKTDGTHEFFYNTSAFETSGLTLPPGKAGLKIDIQKIPAAKGIVEISITHFFRPYSNDSSDIYFEHLRIQADMTNGDVVLLGGGMYKETPGTFNGLFFSNPSKLPTAKSYLILCKKITD